MDFFDSTVFQEEYYLFGDILVTWMVLFFLGQVNAEKV